MKNNSEFDATYHGVPCWFDPINIKLRGKNWICQKLVDMCVFIDLNILGSKKIKVAVNLEPLGL